jgi:NAD(P)-dependent dehydrogenase (short-subunit alcohol dehydrogenase family)
VSADRFSVAGSSILIVGATGALGRAAAAALGEAGARLTLTAGSADALAEVAATVGGDAATVNRRPNELADAEAMVTAAVEAHGGLDGVLVASGINHVAAITDMEPERWDEVMNANVRGSWLVCKAAGRQLIAQGRGGSVVLVSSARGKLGHPGGYSAYCPSKAAVDLLAKTLAAEWGQHGIRVNAIGPTVFRSPLTAWMFEDDERATNFRNGFLARIPLGRLEEPDDLVGPVQFLLSPASGFVTGHVLYADGGYTAC